MHRRVYAVSAEVSTGSIYEGRISLIHDAAPTDGLTGELQWMIMIQMAALTAGGIVQNCGGTCSQPIAISATSDICLVDAVCPFCGRMENMTSFMTWAIRPC
jgi:hypothetical protein